jgi:hypothetical protein
VQVVDVVIGEGASTMTLTFYVAYSFFRCL